MSENDFRNIQNLGSLFADVQSMIVQTQYRVVQTVNRGRTFFYWKIGKQIPSEVLQGKSAKYRKETVATLLRQLDPLYFKEFLPFNQPLLSDCYVTFLLLRDLLQQKLHCTIYISRVRLKVNAEQTEVELSSMSMHEGGEE